jgi:alpha-glucuronidase
MLHLPAILICLLCALFLPAAKANESPALPPAPSLAGTPGLGEDDTGENLWIHYRTVTDPAQLATYRSLATEVVVPCKSELASSTRAELVFGLSHLLARTIPSAQAATQDGAILVGTPAELPFLASPEWSTDLAALHPDGYLLRSATVAGHHTTVIASQTPRGVLYGAFAFLRRIQSNTTISNLRLSDQPVHNLRMWQDWTNWDGSVERGYAGRSHLQLETLPAAVHPRNLTHARAMAALGLNALTLNNVNAQTEWIDSQYLPWVAALAKVRSRYGIRTFLSVRFDSPMVLGGLPKSDPLDPAVAAWWKTKVEEIYRLIPDFGGFVVKADSEGQPGPSRYGRTHADGANMLASALRPHGGLVLWRAFVYEGIDDPDRSKRSFIFYHPQDGKFAPGVILQIKNGPVDFQTREPVHPLFGRMPRTPLALELQITQEYTGQSTHLCFLVPQWRSYLDTDLAPGASRISDLKSQIAAGTPSVFVGVSNLGSDPNWTGHPLAQANHYGFGRLAWNPGLSSEDVANEWIRVTYGDDPLVLRTLSAMLLRSWETYEQYTLVGGTPVITDRGHFNLDLTLKRLNSFGLPFVSADGIGYDRTRATGTAGVDQYNPALAARYESLTTCPPELLFSFHHVPWTHEIRPGLTTIQWLYDTHFAGESAVADMLIQWDKLREKMSPSRHAAVRVKLMAQLAEATRWRRAANAFFHNLSSLPDAHGRPLAIGAP